MWRIQFGKNFKINVLSSLRRRRFFSSSSNLFVFSYVSAPLATEHLSPHPHRGDIARFFNQHPSRAYKPVGNGIARNVPRIGRFAREGAEHQRSAQDFKMRQMAFFVRLPIFKVLPMQNFPDARLLIVPSRSYSQITEARAKGQQARA
jgi:hypothetical protein